jgi:choline dehydrogenase-like flavoprotein
MAAGGDVMVWGITSTSGHGVDCVLGSGPAAVACSSELLKSGRKVMMVNPGRQLAPDREALAEDFRRDPDPKRFLQQLRALRRDLPQNLQTKKLPFSSPHVYEGVERYLPAETHKSFVARSLASGGLSSVWGATVMPMARHSFKNWPVTREEMEPFYRKVAGLMDIPTVHDDLENLYPNYGDAASTALSEQGAQLMANLLNHRSVLMNDGILFGRCRSAVGSTYSVNGQGCVYCGFCMYGCPYRVMFSAEYVVERLKSHPLFTHYAGWIAVGFEEEDSIVYVRMRQLDTGKLETFTCEGLFVACGAATSLRLRRTKMVRSHFLSQVHTTRFNSLVSSAPLPAKRYSQSQRVRADLHRDERSIPVRRAHSPTDIWR